MGRAEKQMRNSSHALPSPGPTLLSGFLQPADELQVARHANKPVGPCSSFQHLSRPLPVAGTIALQQGHRMKTRHLRFFETVREFVSEFQGGCEMLLCRIPISRGAGGNAGDSLWKPAGVRQAYDFGTKKFAY